MVNPERLSVVTQAVEKAVPCSKCGSFTYAKSGVCRACKNGDSLPDPRSLTTERLTAYFGAMKVELERRRNEIAAALEKA